MKFTCETIWSWTFVCWKFFIFLFFKLKNFFFGFLGPHLRHMEVPRLGVQSELQLPAYSTATAMGDPSLVCNLHHSSQQYRIPNPLSKTWDRTYNLMDTGQIHFHCTTKGTPRIFLSYIIPEGYFHWTLIFFSTMQMLFHFLLASIILMSNQPAIQITGLLLIYCFCLAGFQNFLFSFHYFTYLVVDIWGGC